MSIKSINPANGELMKSFEPLTKSQALAALENAHEAYGRWRHTSFSERKEVMMKFAGLLRERQEVLAKLITLEMGKRISESRYEIEFCAEIVEFYAKGAEEFLADHAMDVDGAKAYIQYTPLGVLVGVMPWNFPFYQVVRFIAPNLMAGNTALVRHAGIVPQCAAKIGDLLEECGLPDGVFTNLFIPHEFVDLLISHKHVRGASLTGSEAAGSSVAAVAGKNLKPSVLELGGNDPFIVLEDADLEKTVEMAIKGRMTNTGQSCVASKRMIVVEKVAEKFMEGLKQGMSSMKLGDPLDEDTDVGPLSSEEAAQRLEKQVNDTVNAGAKVVLGGGRPERKGAYFNPTILTDVTPEMPSYDQELFGPVATVYVVKDEQEAIELANDSSYGLGGSVYTSDPDRARRVAEAVDTGMMFVNQPTNSQADLPFGGIKNSGYGRELSKLGILEFVNKKLIHMGES
ncbi:NAD-dependent succinate-semialdehyde dehydrogenase [Haloferula chungangensis]|uniref:NAD-dependent succinate-semialdehyde dehydrogenase n=1 Tax=Haloferula chungangensis TaxID=1048331 RepID=A0ABW2L2D5_9BACT